MGCPTASFDLLIRLMIWVVKERIFPQSFQGMLGGGTLVTGIVNVEAAEIHFKTEMPTF